MSNDGYVQPTKVYTEQRLQFDKDYGCVMFCKVCLNEIKVGDKYAWIRLVHLSDGRLNYTCCEECLERQDRNEVAHSHCIKAKQLGEPFYDKFLRGTAKIPKEMA